MFCLNSFLRNYARFPIRNSNLSANKFLFSSIQSCALKQIKTTTVESGSEKKPTKKTKLKEKKDNPKIKTAKSKSDSLPPALTSLTSEVVSKKLLATLKPHDSSNTKIACEKLKQNPKPVEQFNFLNQSIVDDFIGKKYSMPNFLKENNNQITSAKGKILILIKINLPIK